MSMTNHFTSLRYYRLVDREPVECTILQWAAWFEHFPNRQVADDDVDGVRVSTVYMGCFDIWFESMVFGGVHDGECCRHRTWNAAAAAHAELLALVRGSIGRGRRGNPPM